jgi:hypothetical protein
VTATVTSNTLTPPVKVLGASLAYLKIFVIKFKSRRIEVIFASTTSTAEDVRNM